MSKPPKSEIVYAFLSLAVTLACVIVARREGARLSVSILALGACPGFFKLFDLAGYLFMYFVLRRR